MSFLVFLYWEFRYRARKWLWDQASKFSRINGIALMFHHVTDEYVEINESCKCKVGVFEKVLKSVKAEGRTYVSINEMIDIIKTKKKDAFAVVTFDDVPDNFYYNAFPILKRLDIPFTLFITTDYIDKPGFLTKNQLLELDNDPLCTIGAHTISHPMLRKVTNSQEELQVSKSTLESLLGHEIIYMAYPYGRQTSVSRRIMSETKNAGYCCAFGTIQSKISDCSSRNMYYIPRIVKNR